MAREITEQDLANKGVSGLPDVPGLTTAAMQKKFDEISRELLVPRFNEMVQELRTVLYIESFDSSTGTLVTRSADYTG